MGEIKVIEKTTGTKIEYLVSGNKVTFGNDELTINLVTRERDYAVCLDICIDKENGLVIGVGDNARKYAAQVEIPARSYDMIEDGTDEQGKVKEVHIPIDFDISLCTLILWGLED